jgi:hypothetical protein
LDGKDSLFIKSNELFLLFVKTFYNSINILRSAEMWKISANR